MSADTQSSDWGAFSIGSANGTLGLGCRGTVYVFQNFENGDKFLFLLADLGFGFSIGFRLNQAARNLAKTLLSDKNVTNPRSYTKITANIAFSAHDLNFSPGGEATAGIALLVAGLSVTSVSAWPFFPKGAPVPGAEVNNDYFTGQVIYSTNDVGLSASAAYQFLGRWLKLWSF
jgi:hypothetical protein